MPDRPPLEAAGVRPEDYAPAARERLNEAVTRPWNRLRRHRTEFRAAAANLSAGETGTGLTNDTWSLPLLRERGFGLLPATAGPPRSEVGELIAPAGEALARFQPSQRYFLLDEGRCGEDDLPRRNLVSALVAFENSDSAAGLSEVAEALSVWLRDSGEDELRRAFVEWLRRVLPRRFGEGASPVVQALEGGGAMLAERAKEWTEQWLREGREQGLERGRAEERALLCRQARRKFDAETAERLSGLLGRLSNPERLAEVGDRIIECRTGAELLDHAGRISRLS